MIKQDIKNEQNITSKSNQKKRMTPKTVVKNSPESIDKKGVPQWFKDAVYEEPHSLDGWFYKIYDRVIINELIANGEIELAKEKFLTMVSLPIEIRKQAVTRSTQLVNNDWQYTNEFQTAHVEDASIFDVTYCYNQLMRNEHASKVIEQLESRIDNINDLENIITNKSLIQRLSFLSQQQESLGDKFPLKFNIDLERLKLVSNKKSHAPATNFLSSDLNLSSFLLRVDLSANDKAIRGQFETWLDNTRKKIKSPTKSKNPFWYKWHEEALLQISDLQCWQQLNDEKEFSNRKLLDLIWPKGKEESSEQETKDAVAQMNRSFAKNVKKYISKEGLEDLLYFNEFSKAV